MNESYHVLVVEDDKQIRDGIEIYLKSQGYIVYKARKQITTKLRPAPIKANKAKKQITPTRQAVRETPKRSMVWDASSCLLIYKKPLNIFKIELNLINLSSIIAFFTSSVNAKRLVPKASLCYNI